MINYKSVGRMIISWQPLTNLISLFMNDQDRFEIFFFILKAVLLNGNAEIDEDNYLER